MAQRRDEGQAYLGVQAMRGIAACMVVVNHATTLWWVDFGPIKQTLWANGAAGVDLFFVISGFVIATSTARHPTTPARFMGRRLARILPLYWIVTLVMLAKLYAVRLRPALSGIGPHLPLNPGFVLASLFLIPAHNARGWIEPVVEPGWTLSFEMFFYLLFALALLLRWRPLRLLTPVLLVMAIAGLWRPESWPAITTLLDPILLEFLAGVWLADAVRKGLRLPVSLVAAAGYVGWIALLTLQPGHFRGDRLLLWGIPAALIVTAAVLLERRLGKKTPKWLLRIGDASYSIYLTHDLVISAVASLYLHSHFAKPGEWAMAGISLLLAVFAGLACYRWVERPLTESAGRWTGWDEKPKYSAIGPTSGVR